MAFLGTQKPFLRMLNSKEKRLPPKGGNLFFNLRQILISVGSEDSIASIA